MLAIRNILPRHQGMPEGLTISRFASLSTTTQVIYDNAAVGESMVAYIELVNDCDTLKAFRIGEF